MCILKFENFVFSNFINLISKWIHKNITSPKFCVNYYTSERPLLRKIILDTPQAHAVLIIVPYKVTRYDTIIIV